MLMLILNAYPHLPALLVVCIQTRRIVMNEAILWEVLTRRSLSNRLQSEIQDLFFLFRYV